MLLAHSQELLGAHENFSTRQGTAASSAPKLSSTSPVDEGDKMPAYPTLTLGSQGSNVRSLQLYLQALGQAITAIDGVFGPETRQAVITFQSLVGLPADGIVGPQTWQSISDNLGVELNLDGSAPSGSGGTAHIPTVPDSGDGLSTTQLVAGGLVAAGLIGVLLSKKRKK